MSLTESLAGGLLAAVLAAAAVWFGLRQVRAMRLLRADISLDDIDRRHFALQARRRLVCAVLMGFFAALLVGWFFLAGPVAEVAPADPQEKAVDNPTVRLFLIYWLVALVVLFALLALGVADFMSTARYARRQQRRLSDQQRAALLAEASRFRRRDAERN